MRVKRVSDNDDLAIYLQHLSVELLLRGCVALAEDLRNAHAFSSGSASEFLHEAERALKEVHRACSDVLSELEIAQVARVLKQCRDAYDRVGGA
jgi:hypothetical protein